MTAPKDRTEQSEQCSELQAATALLESNGYIVLREKSYRQAQERQRIAQALMEASEREAERYGEWARDCLTEERRLRDRVTFLYGMARAHGATVEDLRGPSLGTVAS